jgi:hypothetical protein
MARLFQHGQSFDWNTKPFRGGFAFLEHLDVQRRVIGHKRVNFNEMGNLWASHEKRGLYRRMPRHRKGVGGGPREKYI